MTKKNFHGLLALIIMATFVLFSAQDASAKKFLLNKAVGEPQIKFISKAPLEDINGVVDQARIASDINFELSGPDKSNGNIKVGVDGMQTGISKRDEHLRSKDWLDFDKYPTIQFDLTKITVTGKDETDKRRIKIKATAEGNITIHGKSKHILAPVAITYLTESPETLKRAPGDLLFVDGSFDIALKEFNITGISGVVGSKVGETIKIEFKLYYNNQK